MNEKIVKGLTEVMHMIAKLAEMDTAKAIGYCEMLKAAVIEGSRGNKK